MRARRAGYTILEVAVSTAILASVLGSGVLALRTSQLSFEQTVARGVLNRDTSRAINRVAKSVTGCRAETLEVSADASSASFQGVTGWVDGIATWSNDFDLRLEYEDGELDNGKDDDGDGLIDECQVLLVEDVDQDDERQVVLVKAVREFLEGEKPDGEDNNDNGLEDEKGLCFEITNDGLLIRLTIQQIDREGYISLRTLETTVSFRN